MAITVEARTSLIELVVGMFGAAPGASVLSELVAAYEKGQTIKQIAANLANTTEFKNIFPTFLTNAEFATKVVDQLVGSEVVAAEKAAAVTTLTAMLNAGASRSSVFVDAIDAVDAITSSNTAWANAGAALDNKVAAAVYYSVDKQLSGASLSALQDVVRSVTSAASTLEASKAVSNGTSSSGTTFTLTASADVLTGGAANDTFNANVVADNTGAATVETLTALDELTGGAGTDVLNYTTVGGAALPAATLSGIETINVVSDGAVTANVSGANVTGVVTLTGKAAGGAVDLDTKANVTSITVTGTATTVDIDDAGTSTTDALTTVSVSGNTGALTVDSDKLTSLALSKSAQNATVTAAAATRVLSLSLDDVTGGVITDATATTLNVATTGTKSSGLTLAAAAATAVTVDADVTLGGTFTIAAAKTLTVKGDSLVTVTGATLTALETVDSSASTGGIDSKAVAFGTGVTFTGGAGKDSIQIAATTKAITTGAGDDRVLLSAGTTALGTGGSVDAGDGSDTIAFADGDDAGTATATATFEGKISGFEELDLAGAAGAGVTVNLSNLDDLTKVKLSADLTQALTISNMATGGNLSFSASQTGVTTVGVTNALAGADDSLKVSVSGAAATTNAGITVADVETLALTSTDSDADTTDADIAHTITTLTAAAAKTVTVTGSAGLTLTTFTATTVTSFDASGMTTKASDGGVSWTSGALASAATVTGSGGDDTFVMSAATKVVTVNGGAGDDTITAANALANVLNGGEGNDTVTIGTGNVTVDLGAGNDKLVVGSAATQTQNITLGAGTDTIDINAKQASAGAYLSVKDIAKDDIIDVAGVINGTIAGATLGTKLTLGSAATFANYIDAVAAGDGSTNSIDGWFQLGGNTYLVIDNSAAATFQDGSDIVIELVGTIDLASTTQATAVYTIV